ncbi:hypothetical protein LR48_Vigan404s000300 [Vigna angularis]|uniref:Uncharacterized protein n=1 Tax=Phaseolus angularis TaxID=3914 RepID=A0A0L9T9B4_PHAAN|nr:hypothetical protein LR48_Vigan404s000300 [Vigna angularis]
MEEEAAHAAQRQREVLTASLGTVILVVGRWRKEEGKGSLRKKKKEEGKGSLRKNKKEEGKEILDTHNRFCLRVRVLLPSLLHTLYTSQFHKLNNDIAFIQENLGIQRLDNDEEENDEVIADDDEHESIPDESDDDILLRDMI